MIGSKNFTKIVILLTWILLDNGTQIYSAPSNNDCDNNLIDGMKKTKENPSHQHEVSDTNHNSNNNDKMKYDLDEFYIEHEISALDARLAAGTLHPESIEIPTGCKSCSSTEIRYCLGPSLMNDHCCCDRRFQEMFNHIPHTCYIGQRLCRTIARDCGEYARLRACCCDQHVAFKWKALSNASNYIPISFLVLLSALTLIL